MIIIEKPNKKEKLSKSIANITALAKMARTLSLFNLVQRYIWTMSNIDLDAVKKLRVIGINKY